MGESVSLGLLLYVNKRWTHFVCFQVSCDCTQILSFWKGAMVSGVAIRLWARLEFRLLLTSRSHSGSHSEPMSHVCLTLGSDEDCEKEDSCFWFALDPGGEYKRTRQTLACEATSALRHNGKASFALSVNTLSPYTLQVTNLTCRKPLTYQKRSYVWNLQRGSSSPRNTPSSAAFSLSSRSPRSLRSFSLFMMYHKILATTIFPTRKPRA